MCGVGKSKMDLVCAHFILFPKGGGVKSLWTLFSAVRIVHWYVYDTRVTVVAELFFALE